MEEIPETKIQSSEIEPPKEDELKSSKKWRLIVIVVLIAAGAALAAGYYFFGQSSDLGSNSQASAQTERRELIERVSRLIVLPEDEQPTIATVSDPSQLPDEAFFTNAKTGHKVLIYTRAKKAILYDPEIDKIVEVTQVDVNDISGSSDETDDQEEDSQN